jgi:histidinol dehydrogenase
MIKIVREGSAEFESVRARLLRRGAEDLSAVEPTVRTIIDEVKRDGDAAVLRFTAQFEGRRPAQLFRREYDGAAALSRLSADLRNALELSKKRIVDYHEHQRTAGFRYQEGGIELGMRVRPLASVGVYAPGGKARYPSSVLMSALPAKVAGVSEIVLATPGADDLILAAAHLSGVTAILDAGGAQAIAALAYGTESVGRVDKIVGPGNRYVACAKRLVFGDVGIDSIAGPSEILVLCDQAANAQLAAVDLLSQAEHDEAAYPLCITLDVALAERVAQAVDRELASLPRREIARQSVENNGSVLVVSSRNAMAELASAIAPEHLAIHTDRPEELFEAIHAVGAAFIGAATPEGTGDYVAGPSHVLPTGGAVRYGSPLGVYDFVARTSYIRYDLESLRKHTAAIVALARAEGLEAHARAVEARTKG